MSVLLFTTSLLLSVWSRYTKNANHVAILFFYTHVVHRYKGRFVFHVGAGNVIPTRVPKTSENSSYPRTFCDRYSQPDAVAQKILTTETYR